MNKMTRTLVVTIATIAAFSGSTATTALASEPSHDDDHGGAGRGSGGSVVEWNQALLAILKTPGAQPATMHPTRSLAMLHAAINDAVASTTHTGKAYLPVVGGARHARPAAAADEAAHDVLVDLYPTQRTNLDAILATQLARLPSGPATDRGLVVGHEAAAGIIAARANDGSTMPPGPFTLPAPEPGNYQLTPPNHPSPAFTAWGAIAPFVLERGDQFRPPPPPALTSDTWAQAVNEVEDLGRDTSTGRTIDQTNAAKFWAPPIWITWNQIADAQASERHLGLERTATLFAELNVTFADTAIALYDAKYHYVFWRPITAIRAGTPGNPAVTADAAWNPLATTAPDPSYPGAHSTFSAAASTVLTATFGHHIRFSVTTDTPVGGPRHFDSFRAAAIEAGLSRIYAGQHTRIDHDAGVPLGNAVASTVIDTFTTDDE